jgi:hypothetical protein
MSLYSHFSIKEREKMLKFRIGKGIREKEVLHLLDNSRHSEKTNIIQT